MSQPVQATSAWAPQTVYAVLSVLASLGTAWLLFERGCELVWVASLPLLGSLFAASGWSLWAWAVTAVLFWSLGFGGVTDSRVDWREGTPLVLVMLVLLALVYRQAVFTARDPWHGSITARLHHTPVRSTWQQMPSLGLSHLMSLLLIGVALRVGLVLAEPVREGLRWGPHVGLLRETYFVVRLILGLAVILVLARGVLSYLSTRCGGPRRVSLTLLQQVWRWRGAEDRRVARGQRPWSAPGIEWGEGRPDQDF